MKNKIFMYLFIFTLLIVVFQYVNSKKILEDSSKRIEVLRVNNESMKDSLTTLNDELSDLSLFDLRYNQDAKDYFYNKQLDTEALIPFLKNELYKLNETDGEHPLIPFAASEGRKLQFNTIKMLNHRWIVADFSDGQFWGELLIQYFITPEQNVDFEVLDYLLYTR
ncbi:hydrolase [Olleya sp. YSTF-M6]|uniref:Hydrolase n=1 Tax=Olleya sediminilitoris TaxID=2795739 RepID=A0ABS1WM91_9FLAO|nr:hydrolase [Olleya sediminilitoris]MBL7560252.1 hydrolase [Olleya sediminilitoris]